MIISSSILLASKHFTCVQEINIVLLHGGQFLCFENKCTEILSLSILAVPGHTTVLRILRILKESEWLRLAGTSGPVWSNSILS